MYVCVYEKNGTFLYKVNNHSTPLAFLLKSNIEVKSETE